VDGTAVTASDPSCSWTAFSTLAWVSMNANGKGNGIAPYAVAPNYTNSARASQPGDISVAGQNLSVLQPGVQVSLALDADSITPSNFTGVGADTHQSVVSLTVRVADTNGQVLPNYEVRMTVEANANVSGHQHSDPPTGTIVSDLSIKPPIPVDRCFGYCQLQYVVPEISGDFGITAALALNPSNNDVETIHVTISSPAVNCLQPITGSNLVLTGSYGQVRCDGSSVVQSKHSDNHWGQSVLARYIPQIGDQWFDVYSLQIRLNDISLPLGGLFDIDNNWAPPHVSHRLGYNADVEWNVGAGPSCRPLTLIEREILRRTILGVTHNWPFVEGTNSTGGPHFHLNRSN